MSLSVHLVGTAEHETGTMKILQNHRWLKFEV